MAELYRSEPARHAGAPSPLELVMSRWNHSKNNFNAHFLRTGRWYDLFRGWSSGTYQRFRNNVSLPLIFSTVWTDVARKMNISFGVWPYVSMFGYGPEDIQAARKNELLISAQMRDAGLITKAADMFLMGDLYGTAIYRHGWKHETKNLRRREAIYAPMSGTRGERTVTEKRVTFDGPNWDVIDILDFFPQPGVREIKDMDWVIHRYYMDLDKIDQMSMDREDGSPGEFDRTAYLELKNKSLLREVEREFNTRTNLIRSPFVETDTKKMERYAKPVEILEMWGTVPSEMSPDGFITERVICVANRQVVLCNTPNPYWHGEKPFGAYSPLRDPHFFHGIGKVESVEKLQYTMNRIANQKLDALDIFLDPVFAYNRQAGVDTRNLYMRSGKLVGVNGDPSAAIMPIIPNLSQIQNAYQEIGFLHNMMQHGTGITDGMQTENGNNEQTAREFLSRQESVSVRLLLESRFAEEMWIEPLADSFVALNKQFLETPKEIRILGTNALVDPISGVPLQPESVPIDLADLNHNYDVRARGATQTIGKAARQQNMVLLLNAVQANPFAAQMVNWSAFFRDMFATFEMGNIDELLTPSPQQQMMMQQMQAGMLPGSPAQPGMGGPEAGIGGAPVDLMSLMGQGGEAQQGSIEGTLSGY